MSRTRDAEARVLALLAALDIGPAALRALQRAASDARVPLADAIASDGEALARAVRLPAAARAALRRLGDPEARADELADALDADGIAWLVEGAPAYPARLTDALADAAPPVLFTIGDPALLSAPSAAIVGSRRPARASAECAARLARELAAAGLTVVSGGAAGIDTAAHRGALEAGATAMAVPTGIRDALGAPAFQHVRAEPGPRLCCLSAFPPDAPWKSAHAIRRNRLIVALSDFVIALDPRDHGGTWSSARFALELGRPLFFVTDERTAGRRRAARKLMARGASRLDAAAPPEADEIRQLAREMLTRPRPAQSPLFGGES
jgi:DNA processing protein